MSTPVIVIDNLYGNCPVQADGTIDGEPFYFRARGESWSLEIGPGNTHLVVEALGVFSTDRASADEIEKRLVWRYEADWPAGKYGAGWMPEQAAQACIAYGAEAWLACAIPASSRPATEGDQP